jgi:hypothetical protein
LLKDYITLGQCLLRLKDYTTCAKIMREANEIYPKDVLILKVRFFYVVHIS